MTKWKILWAMLLVAASLPIRSQTLIGFDNPGSAAPCAKSDMTTPCVSGDNRAKFIVDPNQTPEAPPPAPSTILPRFKAFWITGDGNYWEFPDTRTDAESLAPTTTYNYSRAGQYTVSVFLTGKYTDHNPPPGAARQINVGAPGPTRDYTPTPFNRREGSGDYDFFPMHELRNNYKTPMILSYPATLDTTWCYLFYNGHASSNRAWAERPLVYQKTPGEVANYNTGTAANINSYPTTTLASELGLDGSAYRAGFSNIRSQFNDFIYFPMETAPGASMPSGFTQKRYFPVLWADNNPAIVIGANDSLMRFCFIVTSTRPLSGQAQENMSNVLGKLGLDIDVSQPINIPTFFSDNISAGKLLQQQGSGVKAQYIQGVYTDNVAYVSAHDPNQLIVQKIEALPDGKYLVTFNLEMCNKGAGNTDQQTINLFDRFGRFHDFKYLNNLVGEIAGSPHNYEIISNLELAGIPKNDYEMQCKAIEFTAVTDCEGIRSLWAGNAHSAFEVCVKFAGAHDVECGENLPMDTCGFKIDNSCVCLEKPNTCGCDDWMLVFVLVIVLALIIWKYFFSKD